MYVCQPGVCLELCSKPVGHRVKEHGPDGDYCRTRAIAYAFQIQLYGFHGYSHVLI